MLTSMLSFLLLVIVSPIHAKIFTETHYAHQGIFSGRASKVSRQAHLVRFYVTFKNQKFLGKGDRVDFFETKQSGFRCTSFVVSRAPNYLLVQVPNWKLCTRDVVINQGMHFFLFAPALKDKLNKAREVSEILAKKRIVKDTKLKKDKKNLVLYLQRVEAVNDRYEVLQKKLEQEWQQELAHLESTRIDAVYRAQLLEREIQEIDAKLEQYRVHDRNLEVDRWSLDHRLYFQK